LEFLAEFHCDVTTMKRTRFAETQIVSILKEADAGTKVKDICRQHGISDATFYNCKSRYGGMSASELKRLKKTEADLSQYNEDVCGAGPRELCAQGSH
jgi:putative transposase